MSGLQAAASDLIGRFAAAWNAADADALARLFEADASFVNIAAGLAEGRAAIASMHRSGFAGFLGGTSISFSEIRARPLGPAIGLAHGWWTIAPHHDAAGRALPARTGLLSLVLRESERAWAISAGHNTQTVPLPPP